ALLQEILALGGSKDDMQLLGDEEASADEEMVTEAQDESNLAGDIGKMLSELGLGKKGNASKWAFMDGDDDDEEEEDEEEEEDSSDVEEMDDDDDEGYQEETNASEPTQKVAASKDGGQKLLVEAESLWHQIPLAALSPVTLATPSSQRIDSLYEHARELVENDAAVYEARPSLGGKDRTFLRTLLKSGTLTDRVSALTLLVQESPVHAGKTFASLMSMARKNNRKEAVMTIATVKDLFTSSLLPERKLKYFREQPITHPDASPKHLALWYFEDFLKKYYYELLQVVEGLSHDMLTHVKLNMLGYMLDMLAAKPEQEQNLLKLIVNKLGDREKKVASKASHLLLQLLVQHPQMKLIVIRAIEEFLVHAHDVNAQYYAIVTLNQVILTRADVEAANRLVDLYFAYFHKLLKRQQEAQARGKGGADAAKKKKNRKQLERERKAEEELQARMTVEAKMIAQLLTGVNRAFPFAKVADDVYNAHLDTLYKIVHTGTFNVVVQALRLIFQASSAKQAVSDRFYRVLYETLMDPRLGSSSKQAMYLNLLYRALKDDSSTVRVMSFIKRITQIVCFQQAPFSCGALYLLMQENQGLKALVTQPEDDEEEEHFTDVDDGEEHDADESASKQHANASRDANPQKYDGRKRDPRYAGAEKSCLWELVGRPKHYHPSVEHHVQSLLQDERINELPQLHLHTLTHFLDRFVYRNPKKRTSNAPSARGASIMQPAERDALSAGLFVWQRQSGLSAEQVAVNSDEFRRLGEQDIKADELFFHRFFATRQGDADLKQKKKRKRSGADEDDDELADSDVEAALLGQGRQGADDSDEEQNLEGMDSDSDALQDSGAELPEDEEGSGSEDEEDLDGLSGDEDAMNNDEDGIADGADAELAAMWSDEGSDSEDGEEQDSESEEAVDTRQKGKKQTDDGRAKKRRRQALPTFASFDDYAAMIERDEAEHL
ncbi:CBF/Mak21 family-domain-containing protein, partial [Thamnocephalis sphaerospora]